MRVDEINSEAVQKAIDTIPEDSPVFMLNLLRYKEQADYVNGSDAAPCSGREAYFERYIPAFTKIVTERGITGFSPFFIGNVMANLIVPTDEYWDDVAIIEYENYAAFRSVIESPEYERDATPHRDAALEDTRLIAMSKMTF